MSDANDLQELGERLAERLRERWTSFDGHDVRVDAGDAGMIYVALRGARGDHEAGQKLAEELESWFTDRLDDEPAQYDFAISLGRGDEDLLLQIDVREVE